MSTQDRCENPRPFSASVSRMMKQTTPYVPRQAWDMRSTVVAQRYEHAVSRATKTPFSPQLFLCLSRACPGRMIVFISKWLQKRRLFFISRFSRSVNDLAVLYNDKGEPEKAVPLYQQAVLHCRRLLGDSHPSTLRAIQNLGEATCATAGAASLQVRTSPFQYLSRACLGKQACVPSLSWHTCVPSLSWQMVAFIHLALIVRTINEFLIGLGLFLSCEQAGIALLREAAVRISKTA